MNFLDQFHFRFLALILCLIEIRKHNERLSAVHRELLYPLYCLRTSDRCSAARLRH